MKLARRREAGQQRYAASLTGSKMRSQSSDGEQGSATDYKSIKSSAVNRFNFIVSYHDVCVWCDDGQTRVSYLHSANRRLAPASAAHHWWCHRSLDSNSQSRGSISRAGIALSLQRCSCSFTHTHTHTHARHRNLSSLAINFESLECYRIGSIKIISSKNNNDINSSSNTICCGFKLYIHTDVQAWVIVTWTPAISVNVLMTCILT